MMSPALTDAEADELDGTLPGVMPEALEPLTTPARATGIIAALCALWALAAAHIGPINSFTAALAMFGGDLLDMLGILSPADGAAYATVGDHAARGVEQHLGEGLSCTPWLIVVAVLCLLFGYTIGKIDRARRRPGRRVRYRAAWRYGTKMMTVPQTIITTGPNGTPSTTVVMQQIPVEDRSRTIVELTASRKRDGEWTLDERELLTEQQDLIEAALAELRAEAQRLDLTERERLAGVYAARRVGLPT